jgi:hypothetical protein
MKYLLKIILLSIAMIPFSVFEFIKYVWIFDSQDLKTLWSDYCHTVKTDYRRAFPRRSRRPSRF